MVVICGNHSSFAIMRVLMVCLGNICRSPIAEGVLRHQASLLGLNWHIDSAGTNNYHTGEPPHKYSQKVCLAHGIDISYQRAQRFTPAHLSQYDIIYAMATDVLQEIERIAGPHHSTANVHLFLNELQPGTNHSVPDPWYGDESGYTPVFNLISDTCTAIINKYTKI